MNLDHTDRKLINLVQCFPLASEPYRELGESLGIDEAEVINRIKQLKEAGLIRQISPVFDAVCLGYRTTLSAMRVDESRLEKVESSIKKHPGVSHGYKRDHYFNLWLTLAVSNGTSIEAELDKLAAESGAEIYFSLPTIKRFKIGAYFDMGGNGSSNGTSRAGGCLHGVELSELDKALVNELQQDLLLVSRPFAAMAEWLNISEELLLERCRFLQQQGVMRRFGASVNHHKAGFKANAMTCWAVPPGEIEAAGKELASLRQVSHCYERATNPHWRYNLFAMIHGHSRSACHEIINEVSSRLALKDFVVLFSTKEFKKTRNKYLV